MEGHIFYGKYKSVRNAAWSVFIDFKIESLPVRVIPIAKQMGITVLSYLAGKEIIDFWGLGSLCKNSDGFTVLIGEGWYIFYDETLLPRTRIRFTLAHELGHFLLGHELKTIMSDGGSVSFTEENIVKKRKNPVESEADMFALRLLAPSCVLWSLNITEADDITALCGICLPEAKQRAKRMKVLYQRDKFLQDEKEKKVYEQFKPFIEMEKSNH